MFKRLCSSRGGVHLGPEKGTARQDSLTKGSIDTNIEPPLFSFVSTFKVSIFRKRCYPNARKPARLQFFNRSGALSKVLPELQNSLIVCKSMNKKKRFSVLKCALKPQVKCIV